MFYWEFDLPFDVSLTDRRSVHKKILVERRGIF